MTYSLKIMMFNRVTLASSLPKFLHLKKKEFTLGRVVLAFHHMIGDRPQVLCLAKVHNYTVPFTTPLVIILPLYTAVVFFHQARLEMINNNRLVYTGLDTWHTAPQEYQ